MGTRTRRTLVTGLITSALMLAGAATAAADPGPGVPPGPGFCLGPPGQSGLVDFAKEFDMPPGQIVSLCNGHGHGQNQAGGGGVS